MVVMEEDGTIGLDTHGTQVVHATQGIVKDVITPAHTDGGHITNG